ncbi:hypothetical protein NLG97_g3016 [Lecanicillium saksenae]|uniref:Uncharacterized protein n=1 Tax=Lecanicillium saksenae TaxID=468837 RepID=A0ACC1QZ99_9HYPO|nr:hypothetical protein NLG97_g3016 [Lecanicillium saksenae]
MADFKRKRADSARSPSRRPPPVRLPCPSWVMSTRSDVHIAKDRSWFGDDYKTISSFIHGPLKDERAPVIGVGTVILTVKVSPDATNRDRSEVKLCNVLHTPDSICNIIGTPIFEKYHISLQPGLDNVGTIALKDNTPVGHFRLPALNIYELRLAGPPIGPRVGASPFEPDSRILVIAKWPEWERDKWERRLDEIRDASSAGNTRDNGSVEFWDRVSNDERHWVRKTYGNEFKFMGAMRFDIKDERDRQEGLRLMRTLIKKEGGLHIIGNAAADAGLNTARKPEQATGSQESSSGDKGFKIARILEAEPNRVARAPTGPRHMEPSPNDKGKQNAPNNQANNQPNKAAPKPAKNKGPQEPTANGKGSQSAPNSKAQTAKNGAGNPAKNNQQHKPAASDTNRQVGRSAMAETAVNGVPLGPPRTPGVAPAASGFATTCLGRCQ